MTCVVCGRSIGGEPCFANSYERIRGLYACCSSACTSRFDPDRHWIPAAAPQPLEDDELARLSRVLRERLANGDRPVVVVREMLVAGLPPQRVRLALADDRRPRAAPFKLLGVFAIPRRRSKRDPRAIAAAVAAIGEWPYQ